MAMGDSLEWRVVLPLLVTSVTSLASPSPPRPPPLGPRSRKYRALLFRRTKQPVMPSCPPPSTTGSTGRTPSCRTAWQILRPLVVVHQWRRRRRRAAAGIRRPLRVPRGVVGSSAPEAVGASHFGRASASAAPAPSSPSVSLPCGRALDAARCVLWGCCLRPWP